MKKIIPRKTIYKKILPSAIIFSILGFGLIAYNFNVDFINNFKPYHIKSYTSAISYSISRESGNANLASVIGAVAIDDEVSDLLINKKTADSVPVLLYHGIVQIPDGKNILESNFTDQMITLKKAGWNTVTIAEFYSWMRGELELPENSFLLTFDDGRKDSYYPVDPILRALNYNAVIYIITGRSLNDEIKIQKHPFHLNESELKKMQSSGRWEIQAHTKDGHEIYPIDGIGNKGHYYSNKLWLEDNNRLETESEFQDRIHGDFSGAKEDLEKKFDKKVTSFAFPFGDFGQGSNNFPESKEIILRSASSIYSMAFYQVWSSSGHRFNYPNKETFLMKRIGVDPEWSGQKLLENLEKGKEKIIPYQDNFSKDNGWQKGWGDMNLGNNFLKISANAPTTGSEIFLGGTYLWQDYVFKANVNLTKGQSFSLMARYMDDKNYVACSFSDNYIRSEQVQGGKKKILSELKGDFVFIGKNREVGIGIYNNIVNCYLDNKIIIKGYDLTKEINNGGIGFKTWDSLMDNSELVINNLSVKEIK